MYRTSAHIAAVRMAEEAPAPSSVSNSAKTYKVSKRIIDGQEPRLEYSDLSELDHQCTVPANVDQTREERYKKTRGD